MPRAFVAIAVLASALGCSHAETDEKACAKLARLMSRFDFETKGPSARPSPDPALFNCALVLGAHKDDADLYHCDIFCITSNDKLETAAECLQNRCNPKCDSAKLSLCWPRNNLSSTGDLDAGSD